MDAKHDGGKLMTPKEVAARLGVKTKTLANWRAMGIGPLPFVRVSRKAVRYSEDVVARFLADRTIGADDDAPFAPVPMTDDEIGAIGQFDGSDDEGEDRGITDDDGASD